MLLETGAVDGATAVLKPGIGSLTLVVYECDKANMDFDNPERSFITAERLFAAQFCEREPWRELLTFFVLEEHKDVMDLRCVPREERRCTRGEGACSSSLQKVWTSAPPAAESHETYLSW